MPSVEVMVKNGKKEVVGALYITALYEVWGLCDNIFTKESVTTTALMLVDEYPNFRPEEVLLLCKNGISGKYGKIYGKVSPVTVMEWARDYDQERFDYFDKKVSKPKADWRDIDTKLFEGIDFSEERAKVKTAQQKNNEIHQELMREFDKLDKKQNGRLTSFVSVEDKMMDVTEYINHKLK